MSFDLDAEELSELVKNRDTGDDDLNQKYGGVAGILKKLKSDPKTGITEKSLEDRQQAFGTNRLVVKKLRGYFSFLFEALQDKILIILMVAATVSIVLGLAFPPPGESRSTAWIEGAAVLIAVVVVSNVTAGNDWTKEKKFAQLTEVSDDKKIKLVRDGQQQVISTFDIVVGDILLLESGDFIPADALFIEGQSIKSDDSAMTGEPETIQKNKKNPWFLSGCMITEGVGKAVVVATGPFSQWGRIKASLEKEGVQTPLQTRLENLAENIGKMGTVAAILTFLVLILKFSIETFGIDGESWEWSMLGTMVSFVITAIIIIVVAVPEGLPLAVTISLAYSMMKMMKDQNLVRHLAACETMGGATQICSDKTGTLTQNRMTVVKLKIGDLEVNEAPTVEHANKLDQQVLKALTDGIGINSSAYIAKRNSEKPDFVGAKTECALLVMSDNFGVDYEKVRDSLVVKKLYPFSSSKKRSSALVETDDGLRLYLKGASEVVLQSCNKYLDASGKEADMDMKTRSKMNELIEEWAGEGLRTLSLAYRDFPADFDIPKETPENNSPLDSDLILVAIVGIEDPLRPEVPESVRQCQAAGITVRMLTGDNILTAQKIAKNCGIMTEGGIALEGPVFRKMPVSELMSILPKLQVIARCSPEDKLILVKKLREMGEVVAVTGDGTNDAPQLREADVGFAMGISGTDVAKDASDIILLDDNFSSIEKAVLWGRNVYDSIRKFVQFQLTVNIVAVLIAFIGSVTGGESPLAAVQLLWVNLIMDTMAALALATERPTLDLLNRKPYGRYSPLITPRMWRMIIGQSVFQLIVLLFTLYAVEDIGWMEVKVEGQTEDELHDLRGTVVFNTFVFCQIFNEFNARKLNNELNMFQGIFKNWIFGGVIIFTLVAQFILVQFGGTPIKTVGLNAQQWAYCVLIGSLALPIGLLLRFIPVPDEKVARLVELPRFDEEPLLEDEMTSVEDEMNKTNKTAGENWNFVRQTLLPQIRVVSLLRRAATRKSMELATPRGSMRLKD